MTLGKFKSVITMSLDGYVAGPDQSEENPLGVGGEELHEWMFPLKVWRESHGDEGGEVTASSPVVGGWFDNVGAVIMGRNMFGGGLGEEGVVAGVEFHDVARPTGELALQLGGGALVLCAEEVCRGHVLPGR